VSHVRLWQLWHLAGSLAVVLRSRGWPANERRVIGPLAGPHLMSSCLCVRTSNGPVPNQLVHELHELQFIGRTAHTPPPAHTHTHIPPDPKNEVPTQSCYTQTHTPASVFWGVTSSSAHWRKLSSKERICDPEHCTRPGGGSVSVSVLCVCGGGGGR
jgi:hypothetical protein